MAHTHPVVDSDPRFVINSTTRAISTTSDKLELIQGDHQSERITFEIPKIVEGHDMSLSDRIEIHYINIDRKTNATSRDVYIIDDAAVDGDKLTFSWLISGNATKYYGRLNFIILFECLDPGGNYTYKWNTEICKLLTIGEGISNASTVIEDHSDILEKFKKEILEYVDSKQDMLIQSGASVGQIAKIAAVDASGVPTAWEPVDLPSGGGVSDYTELSNKPKINGVELSGDKTSADYGIGNPTDEQVASSVEAWLDAHPEATTTVADGSVTEKKTTFFTEKFVELFGELEVGFRDSSLSGYHKKMIPVEPGKTYIVNWRGWMDYFDENKASITEGYTMTKTDGPEWRDNYTLTIPEGSSLRYIRTTVQDATMTDSFPSCYEGSVNIGEITRGSKLVTFDYADNEKMENAFEAYSGENLIDGSQCTLVSGNIYLSQLVPVKAGEKYYKSCGIGPLRLYNHCGKPMPHNWTYPDDWQPDTGTPVTGDHKGVYTIPEYTYFVASTTTLTNGNPNHWLVKSPKIITAEQLGKPFIGSDIPREFVNEYFDSQQLYGLTLCCLGDSVTNMSGYGALVAAKYGMTNIPGGTDGASYTSADGLADNQIAYNKVNSLDADTDVVVLMFGTNDISNSREIGTFTDNDLTTLYGALRKTFDLLTTKFTGKRIGVVTSPQRNFNTCAYDTWKQYNDVIKKMAMLYKIPVLDGEYAGLVYGLANDYSHFTDNVHPASAGSAALAYNIGKFIETLPIYYRDGE